MKRDRIIKAIKQYLLFLIGLFIASMGVAFSTKAGLGTSPVASVPYSISLVSDLFSFGGWLNVLSVIQIAVQIALLRRRCRPLEIVIQTVLAFVYGYLTYLAVSCFVLAFGIWLQFKGGVAMLPGEAMNRAISQVTGRRYENIKISFGVVYLASSAGVCLVFLGELKGVREGSIISAVAVGLIIKLYNKVYTIFIRTIKRR